MRSMRSSDALSQSDGHRRDAGVTQIGNVLGYYVQDGERVPMSGKLIYRGIRRGGAHRRVYERGPLRL